MALNVKERSGFRYVDEGSGEVLMLLNGLFGVVAGAVVLVLIAGVRRLRGKAH